MLLCIFSIDLEDMTLSESVITEGGGKQPSLLDVRGDQGKVWYFSIGYKRIKVLEFRCSWLIRTR